MLYLVLIPEYKTYTYFIKSEVCMRIKFGMCSLKIFEKGEQDT